MGSTSGNALCRRADAIMGAQYGKTIFGTDPITGSYSIAEGKDLLAAKDKDMAELARQSPPMLAAWRQKDAAGAGAWDRDYASLKSRYAKARDTLSSAISKAKFIPVPDNLITADWADSAYKGLLTAINPSWTAHKNAPGSIGDLMVRLGQGSKMVMEKYDVPQPSASSDASLQVLQHTPAVEKVIDPGIDAARRAAQAIQDELKREKERAEHAFDLMKWFYDHPMLTTAIAASLGVVGIYVLYRITAAAAPVALRIAEVATPQGKALTAIRAVNAGLGSSQPSAFQSRVKELQGAT